jgi:hypothetical protein
MKIQYTITQSEIIDALRLAYKIPFSAEVVFRWAGTDHATLAYPIQAYGVAKKGEDK